MLVHPGVVASGLGIRWKIGLSLYARGSHTISVELFHNISYFARVCFHLACAGVCECLDLRRGESAEAEGHEHADHLTKPRHLKKGVIFIWGPSKIDEGIEYETHIILHSLKPEGPGSCP
eukprot:1155516-Pelagomonas_calceolata.AAC.1